MTRDRTHALPALALHDDAAHRGFVIGEGYRDEGISRAKDSRPALDRLMKDARVRKGDVVVVARLDNLNNLTGNKVR